MIAALLTQKYRNGRALLDHEIAHIMIALLMAGQHTSSASGSWALLHLADRPDVADALYQEQVKYFGAPDGSLRPMTYEELRQLPLLDCVLRETLRVHPPIHSIMRKVRSPVEVPLTLSSNTRDAHSPLIVPAGNFVLASPAVSQVDPLVWKDPLKWDPSRWSDPEGAAAEAFRVYADEHGEKIDYGFGAVSKGTESPYQPFGAGRHRCIGEQVRSVRYAAIGRLHELPAFLQFAYVQLGTILATVIRRMEFKLNGPVPGHNYHVRHSAYLLKYSLNEALFLVRL
jgi:sterol 14-demethylase